MNVSLEGHGPAVLHLSVHTGHDGERAGGVGRGTRRSDRAAPGAGLPGAADVAAEVCLDLSGLEFLDAAGLGALRAVQASVIEHDGRLVVQGPRPLARRILQITGLDDVLTVQPAAVNHARGDTARAALSN